MKKATKRLLALVLAAAMMLSVAPVGTHAATAENLALNRPATASNVEAGTSFTANKAVDGNESTRWATDQNVSNPWIEIDLVDGSVVKQINIMFERDDAGQNILGFKLEAMVNGSYETVYTHSGSRAKQREKIILPEAVTAEKLKLTVTNYDGGTMNWASVSVCEIEVYDSEAKTLTDVASELGAMAGTVVDGEILALPEAPDGITVEMNGADFEQIIGKDLSITKPLTDKTVNVSFHVSDGTSSTLTADIPVVVKGLYEQAEGMNAKPSVIPEIQEWYSESTEKLAITDLTEITYDDQALLSVVEEFMADYYAFTGIGLTANYGEAKANAINFSLKAPDEKLGEEGYIMEILADRINVASGSTTGNMYGMQTILQMTKLDAEGFAIGMMRDYPRFEVRGLLLDMARKPIAMIMVGDIARTMRYYKMNDLQLHLNDNYIWLEEYGTYANEDEGFNAYEAFRLESSLTNEAGEDPTAEDYYVTKDEMRTFIQTQRELGMNIVPEIDVPAHAMSFTKVWPELSIDNEMRNGHTLIDHFDLRMPAAIAKIKEIFDDYTKGENPTFDSETTVHIGADEFYLSGTNYRQFFNEMVPYIKETNTIRLWGSLTYMNDNNQTKIIPEAIENVQMNLWSSGWANFQDMFDMGFELVNTIDTYGYMVPNGGYGRGAYGDLLNLNSVFSSFKPNQVGSITLPSSDDQILGSAFAIWNDNIDRKSSGLTESDIFYRFFDALPFYAEKNWAATGQEKGSATALTELSKQTGLAPNTNPYFEVESNGDVHASYDFETMADASGNGRDLIEGTASIENGTLNLTGGNSYIATPIAKIGNRTSVSFDITLTEAPVAGQILFETTPEYYTHDIRIMDDGTLGFTRELHDYSFGYTLPVGETVRIEIIAEQQQTSLYVDGVMIAAASGKFVHNGVEKKTGIGNSTFALPLERIGSETNAIVATIDNIVVKAIADPADDSRDIPVETLTATAGDWERNGGASEGPANLVLDGNPNTIWHTDWKGTSRANHWIQLEQSEDYMVDGLRYLPRTGSANGIITGYEIQVSNDGVNFETVASGEWANNRTWKVVSFEGVQAKYVRLVSTNSSGDQVGYVFASAAELRITGYKADEQPHEHAFGEWVVTTEPTCTETGVETRTCACGETETLVIPAMGHAWKGTGCIRCDATRENPFDDVPEDSFYIDPVLWAVEKEITNGIDDTHFAPSANCNRAAVVTFLWRAAGQPAPTSTENPFVDVNEGDFFYNAVLWAVENGITNGMDDTHFGPTADCNRAQVVTFLWRAMNKPAPTVTEHPFTDVVEDGFYYNAMLWAVENGITNGMTDTTFEPDTICNRAQVVTFLWRTMGK